MFETTIAGSLPKPAFHVYIQNVADWAMEALARQRYGATGASV